MKKIMSVVIALLICVSQFSFVSAENNYTVKNSIIKKSEKFLDINISVPYFEGFMGADKINKTIKDIVADSISDANMGALSLKELNEENIKNGEESLVWESVLDISYDYFMNKDILSVQLNNYTYSGGAHGMYYIIPITMNIKTGEIYEFKDLFNNVETATEKIQNILIKTIDKNPESYFAEYEKSIREKNGDFNFYIDGDKIIVYFDLYDIAPYSSGIHHFSFKADQLKDMLNDEVYNSIKDAKSLEGILFNGKNYKSEKIILDDEGTPMIPLRVVAESLAYKVSWNKKDGATVNGKPLKDVKSKVDNGTSYVPLQYFTDVLKENVNFGSSLYIDTSETEYSLNENLIVRVFDKIDHVDSYYDLITEFIQPSSAMECIESYAKAVKDRNGAIQYALLSNDLRDNKYEHFKDYNFVTGVSSPWISSYDIKKMEDNSFKITFNLATSVPNDKITPSFANIKVVQEGLFWRISDLDTNQY